MRPILTLLVCLFASQFSSLSLAVEQFSYRVLDKKPNDRANYVQGLEIHAGKLYLSAGEYGKSKLRRYDLETMALEQEQRLNPRLFAEGITRLDDKLYQLTWRAGMMLEFDFETLKPIKWHPISGQGWGLTTNGEHLIYTDGGHHLHFITPGKPGKQHSVAVTMAGVPVNHLNELEWIDGKVWANIYQTDRIVIISPDTGEVTANISLDGLLPTAERKPNTDVLNGIARNPENGAIWVTGKRWPWLYQIELVPHPSEQESR
ncbi:glutaminyl-peptide cyclotransferase [Halioglobus maricola]|uniref:Glutaminyl-peptide cyclotransferase n=1 Tax=Halioglobus maricola TaxID=2601894 RepID=A0A5P9NJS3_9GAMM|nr:glutaminyl-peptide cyclotransferase [Halioglobus maricola]QFU75474.1 glutaminyl-peptide cyclotransferase [Halioglobus maricola]